MDLAFINGRVLVGGQFLTRHAVLVANGRIVAVVPDDDPRCAQARRHDLAGRLLLPGFVDVQVNGGGGVLYNDDTSVAAIERIGRAHGRFGTTGFLPTLISDDLRVVTRAIAAVEAAIEAGVPGVKGIHIEGPFLNEARKGVHDAAKFLVLDDGALALLTSMKRGKTLVTLAPEMTDPATIARLAAAGVLVAAGHTDANYPTIATALRHGLTGFTHLFNAMSQMKARDPGVVGAALYDQDSWCGLIVDGRHVDPVMMQLALRCKRHDRFMLVTDAMPIVGTSQDSFMLQGKPIHVEGDACVDASGKLAGSALTMARAVRNSTQMLDIDLAEAARMASEYPAEFLGLGHEIGRIAAGYWADLVVTDDDLTVAETWIHGRRIQRATADQDS